MTGSSCSSSSASSSGAPDFWRSFHHGTAVIENVHLHYVEGGTGKPMILLPGWPQSWYAWRHVMPLLVAAGRRVIAIDPRGTGDSERTAAGYDLETVASDVHGLVEALHLLDDGPLDVAGHDVGSWIAYTYAADYRDDVGRLAVMDALIPGLASPPADLSPEEANLRSWHFGFNRLDDLPEVLLAGREEVFLRWLFLNKSVNAWAFSGEDIAYYARQMAIPGSIRAAGGYYKSAFSDAGLAAMRARATNKLRIPVLALGAERGVGARILAAMQEISEEARGGVIEACGHYMPEERPERIAEELLAFFADR